MPTITVERFVLNIGKESDRKDYSDIPLLLPRLTPWGYKLVKHINIYVRITDIGERAFHGYSSLQVIILPETLERIERGVFADCRSLEQIHLPDSVTEIGDCAFVRSGLKEIALPKNLQILGFNVFRGCHALESVTLPDSIKEVKLSDKWFENCNSLKEISVCADCVIESGTLPETCLVIYRK